MKPQNHHQLRQYMVVITISEKANKYEFISIARVIFLCDEQ